VSPELIRKERLLEEVIKQEKAFSIKLDFEELIKRGVIERKRATKWTFAILKSHEFPKEALNQADALSKVTVQANGVHKKSKIYFKFPNEKRRLKALNKYTKMKEQLMK
jgi:hypothetical protein